ncbi:AaceriADR049Wp [[Ashbya] aceris (nom. inval.)]|nr:AaceriADR049Wp [[Ashbya] aceris (nom. inval.)]
MLGLRLPMYHRAVMASPRVCWRHLHSKAAAAAGMQDLSAVLQRNLALRNQSLYNQSSDTIRCSMFDSHGTLMGGAAADIRREELIQKHGLLPRDLRKIEMSRRHDLVPIMLVRDSCIMVSLLTIRALVKSDTVLLFDPMGIGMDSVAHTRFVTDLQTRLKNQGAPGMGKDPLPYEFRALESIFITALANLTAELRVHLAVTKGALHDLEYGIDKDKLKFLLVQNKKLSVFHKKSLLMREMMDELMDQDDVLSDMYLTEKSLGQPRDIADHSELEMLLETYYTQVNEIVQSVEGAIANVRTTEEIINIILDSNRNELMLLGLRFAIGLLSLGSVLFVAALYGMNLENFIEEGNVGFFLVTTTGLILMVCLFRYSIKRLHKLQKMTLLGSHGRHS